MISRKKNIYLLLLIICFGVIVAVKYYSYEDYTQIENIDFHSFKNKYLGSQSCKECHLQAFEDWKLSDHNKAMQVADSTSVLGDFNNQILIADGVTSHFFIKEGKYFINTQNQHGENQDFQVLYTFGHYPLQQYLTAFDGGRLQVFRQSWDSRQKKWFHQYAQQVIPHQDWLHWTGNAQNWNMMCASCHSVHLQKNYNPQTDSYDTKYQELTVGCESCHGPAGEHVTLMKKTKDWKKESNLYIQSGKSMTQKQVLNVCFSCHSRRGELTQFHTNESDEIMDEYIPEILATPLYFRDGQALDEVYKYNSFLQSKMYKNGVHCIDCHHPHTGKLKQNLPNLCLQCHLPSYATSTHTFHKEGTLASDCRSCHMPVRTYMGNDHRHDHNFAVPRPDLSEKYGTPNACNTCHTDKKTQWASIAIEKWYGKDRKPHFAEDLIIGSYQTEQSVKHLSKLLFDKQTPDIIRATSLHYLGGIYTQESLELIQKELNNPDSQTRYRAVMALLNFNTPDLSFKIAPLLTDKVRAVRVAAANWFLTQLGQERAMDIDNFPKAIQEFETFVLSQSDFAIGSATAADYFVKINQPQRAIEFYQRAIQKDNQLNYVRLNLANLYNAISENQKALQILKEALIYEPENSQIHYYLALLYNEMEDLQQSKKHFEKALDLGDESPRLKRNYQLLLQKIKNKRL